LSIFSRGASTHPIPALVLTLAALLFAVAPARAEDPAMARLLEILRERGSISEAEYEALSQPAATPAESSAEATPEDAAPAEAPSAASEAASAAAGAGAGAAAGAATGGAGDSGSAGAASADGITPEATLESVAEKVEAHETRLDAAEKELEGQKESILRIKEITDGTSSDLIGKALEGKWYERISIKGYTQFRVSEVLDQKGGPQLDVPMDRSVRDNETFTIRRGRLTVSGDVTDRLFLYAQTDFNAYIGSGDVTLQMRDLYGDLALDAKKEWRLRFGVSKVPYGFVNMQSSQNRAPLERAEGLNSTIEGERDYGAYLMWAPAEIRLRFKDIVKRGLKGSGDYGVVAIGAYNGQGSNKSDQNNQPHAVARVAYPFLLENGQIFELGAQYHWGRFVTNVATFDLGGGPITPGQPDDGAIDQRGALTFVWYPQPFGIEAEWNVGQGPELTPDMTRVESRFLHGGYIQANYKWDSSYGTLFPFTRWNYYKGGRKFGNNAPHSSVNELDAGLEYSPFPEIEFTLVYTHTFDRTNTRFAPYDLTKGADRLGAQVQWNY